MERRILLKLALAGVVAGPRLAGAQSSTYLPYVFSAEEMELLEALCETILPADDRSPGAAAAKVNRYLDVMVSEMGPGAPKQWQERLAELQADSNRLFGRGIQAIEAARREQLVERLAAHEDQPRTDLDVFFVELKRLTLEGYYTSEIGIHEEMRYEGNTAIDEFSGCAHEPHRAAQTDSPGA